MRTRYSIPAAGIKFRSVHPGRMLVEEMEVRGLNANSLSVKIGVPRNRLTTIVKGERAITPDTALRLQRYLGIEAYLWLGLQLDYDLAVTEARIAKRIRREIEPEPPTRHAT